ncbi:MAG TPA: lysoplasmalogenase [Propionibacteriaceae bacterium]|nr:lysoplasmalogenase [Propionibacteriaceae bacterium]
MNRSRRARACLVGYGLASIADVVGELLDHQVLVAGLPMILMPLLAGYLWWSSPPSRLRSVTLVALIFSWLGDWLGDPMLVKIIFFLGAQLAYCVALWPGRRRGLLRRPKALVAYALGMIALIGLVASQADALWLPVAIYGSSLFLMVALASGISRLTLLGALLFVGSDLTIAYGAFLDPGAERNGALIMASYLTAQLLLVVGPRRWAARVTGVRDPYLAGHY